jgi:hypothetical protein
MTLADKPIEQFTRMSERFPEPNEADSAQAVGRVLISLIPIVGGPANELLDLVLTPSLLKRKDKWMKELADVVEELKERVDGFKIGNLVENEAFVSATIKATRIAASTNQDEKRIILRNALINIGLGKGPKDEVKELFLDAIEAFQPSHIKVLNVLWSGTRDLTNNNLWNAAQNLYSIRNYANAISLLHPELSGQDGLLQFIFNDLRNRGFSRLSDPSAVFPQNPAITNLGIEFMCFVLHPDQFPK